MDFGLKHSQKWDFTQFAIHINLIFVLLKSNMSGERVNRFPFSAIVGQPLLKKSLILNAIDGSIGGVLIFGQRGTAKSTAVRALADLLPEQEAVEGCPYGCDPSDLDHMCDECRSKSSNGKLSTIKRRMKVVDLPVSSTEDKVIGSLDISDAIKDGRKSFDPGIMAEANRNILYVDEINLLNDHLVDSLLDAAAMGINTVEREGISYSHPADFILVGTMNPEEGDLRPQLLDRFGLAVYIEGIDDAKKRMTILKRLRERDDDCTLFMDRWEPYDLRISQRIMAAKARLPNVIVDDSMIKLAISKVLEANAEGHRADTVIVKAAVALAAYDGRDVVEEKDIELAAALALTHRSRDPPSPPPQDEEEEQDEDDAPPEDDQNEQQDSEQQPPSTPDVDNNDQFETDQHETPDSNGETVTFETGKEFKIRSNAIPDEIRIDNMVRDSSGRRTETESENGRYTGYRIPVGKPKSIAIDATIRAAATHHVKGEKFVINESDIREKVRERKIGNLIVFAVDASGSMGAEQRMTAVKGAVSSILTDAYQKRDRVALIVFRGKESEIVLLPTNSIVLAKERMDGVPTGGKTPLADALDKSNSLILRELTKDKKIKPLLVVISDGRGNVANMSDRPMDDTRTMAARIAESGYPSMVIDSETGFIKLGLAERLAKDMGAKYTKLEDLRADSIVDAIREQTSY